MKSCYAVWGRGVFRYYANKISKRVEQLKFFSFANKKFTHTHWLKVRFPCNVQTQRLATASGRSTLVRDQCCRQTPRQCVTFKIHSFIVQRSTRRLDAARKTYLYSLLSIDIIA